MTGAGHTHTGIGIALSVYYFSYNKASEFISDRTFLTDSSFDMYILMLVAVVSAFLCISGATAPDWLEIRKKTGGTVIKHRTITHWVLLWVLLYLFGLKIDDWDLLSSWTSIEDPFIINVIGLIALSFAVGGLLHLLTDLPNKMGIPILLPNQRFCLHAWKSGRNEQFLITISYVFSIFYIGIDTEVIIFNYAKLFSLLGM